MNIKNIFIIVTEKLVEFLDDFIAFIVGKSHRLESKFGKESKLISKRHEGFSVSGLKHISLAQSRNNMVVIAPSGTGKTTTVIYPSVFKMNNSMIINDPSGELEKTKNYLLDKGFQVKTLHFGDKKGSIYYNPLTRIRSNADINKVASMLVRNANKENKDFWALKSIELISMFICFVLESFPKNNQNLGNVYRLLEVMQGRPDIMDKLIADKAGEGVFRKYKALISNSDNALSGIISTAIASLNFIGNDETLCAITSRDSFNFKIMRKEKTVLFIRCPLGDVSYFSTITSIFFEQFFAEQFNELPQEDDLDIMIILEELSSLHLPNLANIISNNRKFKMPILAVLQSENQLKQNYGIHNAKTILNNCNVKVYFTGLTDESHDLEKTLGVYEYEDPQKRKHKRPLMTADEIRTMPTNRVLVIASGMKPLYIKTTPHYKQKKMLAYLALEAPKNTEAYNPSYSIEYIDLSKYEGEEIEEESTANEV